jgi:hypothetical protein
MKVKGGIEMKTFKVGFLIGIFLFGLGVLPCNAASEPKKVKVGLIGSWSGPLAPMLKATQRGAMLAEEHIQTVRMVG